VSIVVTAVVAAIGEVFWGCFEMGM